MRGACKGGSVFNEVRWSRAAQFLTVLLVSLTLMGCGAPEVDPAQANSQTNETLDAISSKLAIYHLDLGRYPSTRQGLLALCNPPATETSLSAPVTEPRSWHGPYLAETQLVDAWGHPIRYEHGADQYVLTSNGPDGEPDTSDDIIKSTMGATE